MFHYKTTTGRYSKDIAVGDLVRSRYRSPWYGYVVTLDPTGGLATVRQTHDRRGARVRKPRLVLMHCDWFRKAQTNEVSL